MCVRDDEESVIVLQPVAPLAEYHHLGALSTPSKPLINGEEQVPQQGCAHLCHREYLYAQLPRLSEAGGVRELQLQAH